MFCKTLLISAFAALAAAQSAVLTFTRVPSPITDGEPQAILYATNDTQSPVTIILRRGPSGNLQTVQTLTTDATGGQYIWTPPLSLANGNDYALEIRQAGQNNYFGPFTVQGASPSAVASASALSATRSSSSSSSSISTTTIAAGNSTMNSTMTMTGMTSSGTSTTMIRNNTMNSATMTSTRTTGSGATSTEGAGFEETSSAASASQTGNAAASDFTGKSTMAFVVGALAAVLYLH